MAAQSGFYWNVLIRELRRGFMIIEPRIEAWFHDHWTANQGVVSWSLNREPRRVSWSLNREPGRASWSLNRDRGVASWSLNREPGGLHDHWTATAAWLRDHWTATAVWLRDHSNSCVSSCHSYFWCECHCWSKNILNPLSTCTCMMCARGLPDRPLSFISFRIAAI